MRPGRKQRRLQYFLRHTGLVLQAACRAAAHYLKLFFLSAFERGDVGSRPVQQATLKAVDAQIKLAGWLQHKFDAFTAQLQSLLQSQHSVELQVSCLNHLADLS